MFLSIIRAWCRVAGGDPDSCDERLVEHDAEKGKARIARRSRDDTAEEHLVVGAEILNQRALLTVFSLLTVSPLLAMPLPSCWSTSVKTAPKPRTVAGTAPLLPGKKNEPSVMLLPTGVNNRDGLKVLKILAYVGLLKSSARPDGAAWERPAPGVVNCPPRVFRKVTNGVTGGVVAIIAGYRRPN